MGDFARFQFNEEKGNEWSKAEIGDLEAHRRPTYQQRDYGERSPTSAQMARGRRTCRMYFWIVRLHTRIPSLSNSPRMRSAQKTPIVPCHLLDQCDRLWRELRLSRISLGLALPEQAEEFSMPPKHYLQLRNEERLLPGPHHPRQKQQAEPICLLAGRSFDLPMQDDELLRQQRVFDQQFGLPFGKVCDRSKQKSGGARFQPTSKTIVERVKAQSYSLPERDEKREHRLLLCEG